MANFELAAADNMMWTVRDTETGITLAFREGLYNNTQHVVVPDTMTAKQTMHVPTVMREMGEWMAKEHLNVALCHSAERCAAIWMLDNAKYWVAIATAMKSPLVDFDEDGDVLHFMDELEGYLQREGVTLDAVGRNDLIGCLSLLSDREVMEVINLVHVYWRYKANDMDIAQWASDILWWPAWCPEDMMYNEDDEGE